MGGLWAYSSIKSFIAYLIALIVIVGLPAVILIILLPYLISNATLGYFLKVLGATWAGFALIYPMGKAQKRFSMIKINPND